MNKLPQELKEYLGNEIYCIIDRHGGLPPEYLWGFDKNAARNQYYRDLLCRREVELISQIDEQLSKLED